MPGGKGLSSRPVFAGSLVNVSAVFSCLQYLLRSLHRESCLSFEASDACPLRELKHCGSSWQKGA